MKNRVNLAWIVLLVCFTACMAVTISLPFGINSFVQGSTRRLVVFGLGTQGDPIEPVLPYVFDPELPPQKLRTPVRMESGLRDRGIFRIEHPDTNILMARVEVLSETGISIDSATLPRFGRSSATPLLTVGLRKGIVRITIPPNPDNPEPIAALVNTPNGQAVIDKPGKYTVEFTNSDMQLSVYEGHALLRSDNEEIQLVTDERGVLGDDKSINGPLNTERDLIVNGNFSQGLSDWEVFQWDIERSDQPGGLTNIVEVGGESALRFSREGIGNARTSVSQTVERNVTNFSELYVNLAVRVINQSLAVCGFQGSECPLTLRLDYEDESGNPRAWEQGIYVVGDVDAQYPDRCQVCGFPLNLVRHEKLPQLGEVYTIATTNLIPVLEQEGFRPERLFSVSLFAEGHAFVVDVVNVELIVVE